MKWTGYGWAKTYETLSNPSCFAAQNAQNVEPNDRPRKSFGDASQESVVSQLRERTEVLNVNGSIYEEPEQDPTK